MNLIKKYAINYLFSVVFLFLFCNLNGQTAKTASVHPNMDLPGYPYVFELNQGDSAVINRDYLGQSIQRTITLDSVHLFFENNPWFPDSLGRKNIYKAAVMVRVSGKPVTLYYQPYQMPVIFDGLRIYVEAIRQIDAIPNLDRFQKMERDVRLSIAAEGEPWGRPHELNFPVENYRFRSATYFNTWASLVPYNALYYHKGEDMGAIPDRLEVHAWADGEVVRTPLPQGNKGSNTLLIRNKNGVGFYYAHCNTESIDSTLLLGKEVRKGQYLAKTGMTWGGKKSQYNDPHLHTEMEYDGCQISLYPYFIESYFRKYDDTVLAVAGGYRFAMVGDTLLLDASRSVARLGGKISSVNWKLHNGQVLGQNLVKLVCDKPGLFSEELIVADQFGNVDKDFLQVRVYAPSQSRNIAYGWAYCYPVRKVRAGDEVLFWNRLVNTTSGVSVDYGDGSPVEPVGESCTHCFSRQGNYTVAFTSTGVDGEPVSIKMEVHVD